jgi:hypothetical protein
MKRNRFYVLGVLAAVLALGLVFAGCSKKDSGGSASGGGSVSVPKVGKETPASDFNYDMSEDGKGVVITKYTGNGGAVVIPAKIEDLPVVQIGGSYMVFAGELRNGDLGPGYNLTSVVIPASVKKINMYTFNECKKLTSVTFLGTDVTLGQYCFTNCINLSELKFSDGDQALIPEKGQGTAFNGCTKLPLAVRGKLKEMGFTNI